MMIKEIVKRLEAMGSPENVAGMARFGIVTRRAFGVAASDLKQIAKEIKNGTNDRHALALRLWKTGIHDARAVAYLIDDPKKVTEDQMESWAADFDNWAIVDGTCGHLFCRSHFAYKKAVEWSSRDAEFVKRAGIVLMAWLAVHDKKAADAQIAEFLPILEQHAGDERNFVKKAVNWSLRQIGKRNLNLNGLAIETAERIKQQNTRTARWIASDAIRELTSNGVQTRLKEKSDRAEKQKSAK
ncbi:MAG: DNA alkylation repair protein [Blastocatellia bacterium]|nr:DNA alkylation repair protein [Blastocatellia bacterium]